ncbi:lysophospholipid acyltransferase family protein [Dongshaea marina]|uniref:lysophospholipid acyltransferase family protein n=1 Tax=Dongshaea marina TaxID=2047966 RepID=UPI000D3EA3BA|nr:lysophospholipid acyltransferase family protein [Dongshaea marina]
MLNYSWRLFATGLCFFLFFNGGLFLGTSILPIIGLCSRDPLNRSRRIQKTIAISFRLFVWLMQTLGVIRFSFQGVDKLRADRGCLLVANHPTLIDYVVITSLLDQCNCIVKQTLWQNRWLKWVIRLAGYIPNVQSDQLLQASRQSLDSGNPLLIFPEGTRSEPGKSLKMQRGAAHLALRLDKPLRLIHIHCSPSTLTKAEAWYQIPKSGKPHYQLNIGDRIDPNKFYNETQHTSVAARHLTRYLEHELAKERVNE